MRKPTPVKLVSITVALVALIASVVAFGSFWPGSHSLKLPGEVQAREIKNGSRFGGRVTEVLVQEGQRVQKGQLLVVFEDSDLQAKIAEAKAALNQAMAQQHMLAKGADAGDIRQAGSAVQQAQQKLKILSTGARPEEIAQAESRLKTAEVQAHQAQKTFENAKAMLNEGIISRQKYESLEQAAQTAKSNLEAAQATLKMLKTGGRPEERKIASAQLSAAQAQYDQLRQGAEPEEKSIASSNVDKARSALQALEAQLDEVRIKAPFDGYISVVGVTEEELVPPGRPVITIIDYDHLWTDVYVPESKLSMVSLGEPVSVMARSYKNTTFKGRVALINPKSEFIPNSGGDTSSEESTFRVKIAVSSQDASGQTRLYPGMKVDVLFKK